MYDSNLLQCGYKCPPEGAKGVSVDVDYIDLKKCDKLREKFHDLKKCDKLREKYRFLRKGIKLDPFTDDL